MLAQAVQANTDYYTEKDYTKFAQEEADAVKKTRELPIVPNCMVFVRRTDGQLVEKAEIFVQTKVEHEGEESMLVDKFAFDGDGIFERRYPTNQVLVFTCLAEGYLPGGREKYFFADDPEQLVVNIVLQPMPGE